MSKAKLFIILITLILVMVFSMALICGQCQGGGSEEGKIDIDRDASPDPPEIERIGGDGENEQEPRQKVPTIYLEVVMGPAYAPENDVCFYRVKAVATGDPQPTIEWSKDDSFGAWGNDIAQVNLERGQSYTLTAKAVNSEGTAQDSITLLWECEN